MSQSTASGRTNFTNSSLLVVEDRDDQWVIIEAALQQTLPEVKRHRTTGRLETLEYLLSALRAGEALPSLILLDLYLPYRETGLDLLYELKNADSSFAHLPVVVLSGSEDSTDIEDTYQNGCTSYVIKPLAYQGWVDYLELLRNYWWETVTLPRDRYFL